MARLNLTIADTLRLRVELRARESGFATVEEYIEALLLADAAGDVITDDAQLEELLLKRIDGPFVDTNEEDFRHIKEKFRQRLNAERGSESQK